MQRISKVCFLSVKGQFIKCNSVVGNHLQKRASPLSSKRIVGRRWIYVLNFVKVQFKYITIQIYMVEVFHKRTYLEFIASCHKLDAHRVCQVFVTCTSVHKYVEKVVCKWRTVFDGQFRSALVFCIIYLKIQVIRDFSYLGSNLLPDHYRIYMYQVRHYLSRLFISMKNWELIWLFFFYQWNMACTKYRPPLVTQFCGLPGITWISWR